MTTFEIIEKKEENYHVIIPSWYLANELTDQYIENLPKEERGKVEIQKILMAKSKEMEKIKREMHDKKEQKKYNDDYDIPDNLY